MVDRFPEAEMVLDDELLYDDTARRSTFLRRTDDRVDQLVREGEVLAGKYRVERIPGRSGLGVVVQVRHMELGQEVTLKFLVPDACAYPEFVQRFVREARSAVKIQGEHVARVTDVGRLESGAPYMVREFLKGPDLAEILKVRGPLPIEEAVDYVIQAAEGVAEGHALGVVHRNLRPTTLVVARRSDGTPLVKVFDFAAAEALHVDPFTERSVSLIGTSAIMASLPYLSPEQIRDPHDVDVRADVYSLGAILFELLAGVAVYAADTAPALLAAVAADAAPPLRNFRPDVSGEIDHIVLRCLSKNRAIRYANIAELALALKPFASEDALGSIERIVRLARFSKRPGDAALPRASTPPSLPSVQAPISPFSPSPSAVPPQVASSSPGRGPTGTQMLHVAEPARSAARVRDLGNDDVTTINPYAGYSAPLVISPPVPPPPPAPLAQAPSYTPKPPPLRTSVPPPLRSATPLPPPLSALPPASVPPGDPRFATSLPPSSRSATSGLTRSWAVADEPAAPLLNRNRLVAIAVIAASATLAGVLALRIRHMPTAPAAAALPARVQQPAPPPPVAAPTIDPAVLAAAVAAAAASAATAAAPPVPPVAAVPAPGPIAAPAPAAPAPATVAARAAAPVAPRRAATRPAKAEGEYWETTPAKAPAPAERVARVPAGPAPGLFDDPR